MPATPLATPVLEAVDDLDIAPLRPAEASIFVDMTFPAYRRMLRSGASDAPARPLAVRARRDGHPVGLALATLPGDGEAGVELLSLFVAPEARGRGIATLLLGRLEQEVAERGFPSLSTVYMTGTPSIPVLERVLSRRGWTPPERRALTLRFTPEEAARTPWWDRGRLGPGDVIFPWVDLAPEDRADLVRSQAETGWIPVGLEPWRYDVPGFDERTSIGLRHQGQVKGWVINHVIAADTMRMTCVHVAPRLAARGASFALFREALRRIAASGCRQCTFVTYLEHPRMVRFLEERCAPWVSFCGETRVSWKTLAPAGSNPPACLP